MSTVHKIYLFACEGDFSIRIPDLMALVQDNIVPPGREKVVAIDPHTSIGCDEDSTAFSGVCVCVCVCVCECE